MPVTNYHTANGMMIGETTDGVATDYLTDALGNVTVTLDENGDVLNQYQYKPYGSLLSKTGSGPDPKFLWVGTLGYRTTNRARSSHYVRARHYTDAQGAWTTVDPLWPDESAYGYMKGQPVSSADPSGPQVGCPNHGGEPGCIFNGPPGYERDPAYWHCRTPLYDRPRTPSIKIPPIYGKFCGPQSKVQPKPKPDNRTDTCCMHHDDCFEKHGCNVSNQVSKTTCKKCTDTLCSCLSTTVTLSVNEMRWNRFFMFVYCRKPFTHKFDTVEKK